MQPCSIGFERLADLVLYAAKLRQYLLLAALGARKVVEVTVW